MSRLIVLALLASTAMAVFQPSFNSPIAYRLNARMMELYNAKDFPRLVNELYNEDAIVEVKKYGIRARGHQQIEALLSNTAFGQITGIEIKDAVYDSVSRSVNVVASMFFRMFNGRQALYRLDQKIVNQKFSHFIQSHID